jgi:hypothetical protein
MADLSPLSPRILSNNSEEDMLDGTFYP